MRGLLYASFLLNKGFFIAGGIATVICTVIGVEVMIVCGNTLESMAFIQSFAVVLPIIPMATYCEWLSRDLEKNLKSRFADYTLASGISKNRFVLTELCKNLSVLAVCGVTGCLMMLIFNLVNSSIISGSLFTLIGVIAVLFCTIEWVCIPLVITLKSAEKAGLIVGLIIGFGVCLPVMIVSNILSSGYEKTFLESTLKLMGKPWIPFAVLGVCAVIYAVIYWAVLCRVKRGDVC
ncbi:MAG: hypothetical protein ACI4JS_02550 [Oscillospiraceae bacterium]